jgi:hypothetical protein
MSPATTKLGVRLAGIVAVLGGLLGAGVWTYDLADRADGDSLRFGLWHNPYLQFPIFSYPFVETSCWVLLGCCLAAIVGGALLFVPTRFGRRLVAWQARVAIVINAVTVLGIVWMMVFMMPKLAYRFHGTLTALLLRLGVLTTDVVLLLFLTSRRVDGALTNIRADNAFPVLPTSETSHAGAQ